MATAVVVAVLVTMIVRAQSQILIPAGSAWTYNDSGVDLGTGWRSTSYVDTGWPLGSAPLGYGNGDEATVASYGGDPNHKRITTYFRHSFTVPNPATIPALTLRFIRDDGAVIYLNGVEVARSNMPAGAVSFSTLASSDVTGGNELMWQQVPVDRTLLVQGANVIAVEMHQQSAVSDDLRFDLSLYASATLPAPPKVTLVTPIDHEVTNSADEILSGQATSSSELVSATLYAGSATGTVTLSGPGQVEDAQIAADTPATPNGFGSSITVDGEGPHARGLMKFPALIGSGANRVPAGSIVTSALLQVNCTAGGNAMVFYRLTQDWADEQATWNQRLAGTNWTTPGAHGAGSSASIGLNAPCANPGLQVYDLTRLVQEWSDGAPNYGFVMTETGTGGVDFMSSESGQGPTLTVSYRPFQNPVASQGLSGFNAAFNFPVTLTQGQTLWWNVLVTDTSGQQSWAPVNFSVSLDPAVPDRPVLALPLNGAVNVSPSTSLQAQISDPAGGVLNATASVRPASASEFTMVVLPDTQHYSEEFPSIFAAQTQWIVDNKDELNIVFVTHVGDVVQNVGLTSEWQAAKAAMSKLDGIVPYGIAPGDNDEPTGNYNAYFPYQNYEGLPWYEEHYQNLNDNHYELFSAGGMNFVIVHLEFCPGTAPVTWADSIFKTYPNRIGMLTTHGYLGVTAQRNVEECGSTQYLWDRLAAPNPNLHFMFAGHEHDEARRSDVVNGHPVYQLLADFQDRPSGGNGWLRLLRFVPAENRVYVQTYSPWLNQYETDANSQFTLDFSMGGASSTVAAAGTSGSIVSFNPPGLQPLKEYEWQVSVTNGSGKQRQGPVWRFTTGAADPPPPPPPPPAGSVSQSGKASSSGQGTSIAITHGLNIQANDVVLAFVHVNGNQRVTSNNGGNAFTEVIDQAGADTNGHAIYSRIAGASEPATYQWTWPGSSTWSVAIRVFKNVNNANIWEVAPSTTTRASGNSATATAPSMTINTAGAMGLVFVFSDTTAQTFNTPTNGYSDELEVTSHPQATYLRTWAAGGVTGPVSVLQSTNDWMVYQIALRPAGPEPDATPPVRSNGQPSGALPGGTTSTTISLTTDEPAICRYSTTANTLYSAMAGIFATTNSTSHSTAIGGLADNNTYSRYVRCIDGSNNPNATDFTITFNVAAGAPNSAPTATNVNITGTLSVGQLLTGAYSYGDVDGDLQGASTFRWLRDAVAIGSATDITYTVVAADSGRSITFEVTPRAASGTSAGTPVTSPGVMINNAAPTATGVNITGTPSVGQLLTGHYTYGDIDGDLEGASTFRWLRDAVAIGSATGTTYTVVAADSGRLITFEVTPRAASGTSAGTPVTSPGMTINNTAPTATGVNITGTPSVGQLLTGHYTYGDIDGDLEGASTFRWLRDAVAIGSATGTTYTVVAADSGRLITFEVTPRAASGTSAGTPVTSPGMTINNTAPTATGVNITGTPSVGQLLTGHYTYGDIDGDLEGASTFRWLRDSVAIVGSTGITYTVAAADSGHSLRFEVTVVAAAGSSTGTPVSSSDLPITGPPPVNILHSDSTMANGVGASISITHGLNIQANDVILAFIHVNVNQRVTDNNGASAFTEVIDQAGPDTNGHAIYSRLAGASEPATYHWTRAGTDRWSVAIRVFRNVNTLNIWDVPPAAATRSSGSGSIATAPSVAINTVGAMGIVFVFSDAPTQNFSNPTNGYGGELEVAGNPQATYLRTWGAVGATGQTSVSQTSNDWMAYQIALRPAVVSGGDTTPPVRANGQPSGVLPAGTTSTMISLATNEPATCRYSTTANTAYSSMAGTFTTTGGVSHSTSISGLADNNSYNRHVRCIDGSSNPNTNDFTITFSVAAGSSNSAPTATSVNITGTPSVGQLLSGHYTYGDVDGDLEGASTFRWLRDGVAIGGATGITYTVAAADSGHSIRFEVTVAAATGTSPGTAVSSPDLPIAGAPPVNVIHTASAMVNGMGASISIPHGLNIQANDVIMAFIHVNGNQRVTDNNGTSGFTEVIDQAGPDTNGHAIYSRIAGASEPAVFQWTRAGTDRWSVAIRVFRNVNTANIWDVAPAAATRSSGNGSTATAPSVSINTAGSMGIVFVFSDTTAQSFTNPTNGYGSELELPGQPQATYIRTWTSAGATGQMSVTQANNDWMVYHIALRAAAP